MFVFAFSLPWFFACGGTLDAESGHDKKDDIEIATLLRAPASSDRIILMQANYTKNNSWRILLVNPGFPRYSINMPTAWDADRITIKNDTIDCLDPNQALRGEYAVVSFASGDISWEVEDNCSHPTELTIDVQAEIADPLPMNLQSIEIFSANNLEITPQSGFLPCF